MNKTERTYGRYWEYEKEMKRKYMVIDYYIYGKYNEQMKIMKLIKEYIKKNYGKSAIVKFNGKFKNISGRYSRNFGSIEGKVEISKGFRYLISFLDTIVHEFAHVSYSGHKEDHFSLTKKYFNEIIDNLKDEIVNIILKKNVYKSANVCYNNNNKTNKKANGGTKKMEKVSMIKEFRSKKENEMHIDIMVKGVDSNEASDKVDKLINFLNEKTNDEIDAKHNGMLDNQDDNRIGIIFEREYYKEFNKLYKEFKKSMLKSN
jgi:hypothetical protein